ncbi:MAG: hypothetical protein LBU47_04700 [Christensenellaceae bacterium]|jgi:hypothetical protein|nr:hypothetical protein [Christensenellaceae bacterium]
MRLFHVSEEPGIALFSPRSAKPGGPGEGRALVWAIDEARLPNYLLPRDCPRVTWHWRETSAKADQAAFFSSPSTTHAIAIERGWFRRCAETTLYIYEFQPDGFALFDEIAGYYVSETEQKPTRRQVVCDVFAALIERGVELRVIDDLWPLCAKIQASSLGWSMIRMANARKEPC